MLSVPIEPNWVLAEDQLVIATIQAIENYEALNSTEACSMFAISADYIYGNFVLCFDTNNNSLLQAKRQAIAVLNARKKAMEQLDGWKTAKYFLERQPVCSHNLHTASFQYPEFVRVQFADWEPYFLTEHPDTPDPMGHVIVLLHRVVNRLVSLESFKRLPLTSPFRVAVEFPEETGLVVMRILNWPAHQGPRV